MSDLNKVDKEKIKQKIKKLEALLEEPENKIDTEFKLKLNTGKYHYLGDDTFNCFLTEGQTKIASDRKSAQDELLQMAFILNGDWKPDFSNKEMKIFIYYEHGREEFIVDYSLDFSIDTIYFKPSSSPLQYFLATASDNLKAYIKGELQ